MITNTGNTIDSWSRAPQTLNQLKLLSIAGNQDQDVWLLDSDHVILSKQEKA